MFRYIISGLFLFFSLFESFGQDPVLTSKLKNKNRLDDIAHELKSYYNDPATISRIGAAQAESATKQWRRWLWYMSSRVGEKGELVNIEQKKFEANGNQLQRLQPNNTELHSNAGNWVIVGPQETTGGIGRVDRLAFHPTNANTLWAGTTCGGLWRTTDGGANWTNLTPNISVQAISGIAVNPANTNVLYILTGDGDSNIGGLVEDFGYMRTSIGVLKSTNGGSTWLKTGDFPGADYSTLVGYRLIMHPENPDILYACTNQGLFGTVNGGQTWGLLVNSGRTFNFAFKPGSNNICYAVSRISGSNRASFWKSTTSGLLGGWDTVNAINNQINNPTARVELAVTPANPSNVFLLCGGVVGNGQFKGLYRSTNDGASFSLLTATPNVLGRASDGSDNAQQSNYDLAIAVSNLAGNTIITGGVRCWRYFSSGAVGWDFRGGHHEDVHDLGFHPADNKLWMANDGGVYSSTDNGDTWTTHFEDMSVSQFYRMAVSPFDYLNMIAGAQDNGLKRRTGNTSTFDHVSGADGFTVAYDAVNVNTMYAIVNQNIRVSTDNGDNWVSRTPNTIDNNPFAMSMAASTTQANTIFIAHNKFWRTSNGGTSWDSLNINGGWFLRTCPSNGNRIYMAGGTSYQSNTGVLRRSDDAGVTWPNTISNGTNFPATYPRITSINVNPANSNQVWVTFGGFNAAVKVYYSNDAGATWFNRSGTLPNVPVNCIAIDAANNAYAGTDIGVYYRGAGTTEWVPFYNNLPYVPVTDLVISEAEDRIRASTFGRGIWSSDLKSTCDANLNVVGTLTGRDFFEASNSVSSTASLQLSEGTKVQMRGGTEVRLLPGFTAQESTSYRAVIGPCGSGGVAAFSAGENVAPTTGEPVVSLSPPRQVLIHVYPANGFKVKLNVQNKTAGEVHFELGRADGSLVHSWEKVQLSAGDLDRELLVPSSTAPGLYKLSVWHNGKMQHWQELEVK